MITFAEAVRDWSRKTPTAPAWWIDVDGELRSISWQQIEQAMLQVARSLSERGLVGGDRLVTYLPNGLSWALIDLACNLRGVIHAPVDHRLPQSFANHAVLKIRASILESLESLFSNRIDLTDPTDQPKKSDEAIYRWSNSPQKKLSFDLLQIKVQPTDTATILFTSGTSREPQGVMLSYENLLSNTLGKLAALPQFSSDRRLNLLSFSHAYARTCELSTWALTGGSMMSVSSFEQLLKFAPQLRPTLLNAVPHVFQKLQRILENDLTHDERQQSLSRLLGDSMRGLASGGAGLPNSTYQFFDQLGLPIIQGYGLTEASPVVCSNRSANPTGDSVGPPIQNVGIRIDGDQQLFVKSLGVMKGYWENPIETALRIQDGWLDTGDRAEQLSNGTLRILGRCDDRIVLSTGHKLDPLRIEQRLIEKLGIRNCMLVGNHQRFVIAIVVTDSVDEAELLRAFGDLLGDFPDFCIPKRLILEQNDWTEAAGLIHRKGNLLRTAILDRYHHEIASVYCRSFGRKQVALNPRDQDKQTGDADQRGNEVQQ